MIDRVYSPSNIQNNITNIVPKHSGKSLITFQRLKERRLSKIINRTEINIILLGPSGVGKSSFVIKYIQKKFEPYHITTIGTELLSKSVPFKKNIYKLNFIITSGDPNYKEDYTEYFQNVDFFLIFYDVTINKSFEDLKTLVNEEIKEYLFLYKNNYPNVILIGNKADLKKAVDYDAVKSYCTRNNLDSYEVSVKTEFNINKVINKIIETYDDMVTSK